MLLFPYRSKNPPEHIPYATIGLIAVNTLVYLCTSDSFVEIKRGIVEDFAVAPTNLDPLRLFTSMFLHGDPMHLLGNMLFLWIFGAALEGRLRIPYYLLLYTAAGFAGGLLQMWTEMAIKWDGPLIGASGAIMGVSAAYMYVFPFARIMMFRVYIGLGRIICGPAEWLSWWVVGYYIALDMLNGFLAQSMHLRSGTGHFAHIGGFFAGMGVAMALRVRRDSEQLSEAQATRASMNNDLGLLSANELETILTAPTENMTMVLVYCNKAIATPGTVGEKKALKMIERYMDPLLEKADPLWVAETLLKIPAETGSVPCWFYLKLAGKLEGLKKFDTAAYMYRRVFDLDPYGPDASPAILRFGRIWETIYNDIDMARDAYEVYLKLFPDGPLAEEAEKGLARVGGPKVVAPIHRSATIKRTTLDDDDAPPPPQPHSAFDDLADETRPREENVARRAHSADSTAAEQQTAKLVVPNPFAADPE
ncbi:MAG TPA: rhomboid family intramembrane serine protease [Capsulimonadaceae bacterium]|jgi:membrane associated rhomboid family serine protease